MNENRYCSLKNVIKFIQQNKQKGLKNQKIINELIKKGCRFQIIFDAMDIITRQKEGVTHEPNG